MTNELLNVTGLTKKYRDTAKPAVDDLNLRLDAGEVFGFVGPNGAGKTTTIKMLLNMVIPDSGSGTVLGLDIISDTVEIRENTGFMSGEVKLYNHMTGNELIGLVERLHKEFDKKELDGLCRMFDVPLHRKIKTYSAGQKQQLAIISALCHRTKLLILDEPTKGLDPSKKRDFLDIIKRRGDDGVGVIISSHVLSEIESICTRVGFIREGVLIGDEEIEDVREQLSNVILATFVGEVNEEQLNIGGVKSVTRRDNEFYLQVEGDGRDVLKKLADLPLSTLRYNSVSLDDIYENLYLKKGKNIDSDTEKTEKGSTL